MGDIPLDLVKESAVIEEEDDRFYEEIEAPKFVDFTVPDRPRPEDGSWFCVRIGCDQNHEVVDPEALHKSFVLRVMAARSPNVRLRKTVNQQVPRSLKCPHSAPAKSSKDRIARFTRTTLIPERIANDKIKDHPISSLRSTPSQTKAKLRSVTGEKALTTPRSKKPSAKLEPFRSVKYQKTPIGAPRDRSVAKALFVGSPKKTAKNSTPSKCRTPVSEICAEMRKLKMACPKDVSRNHPSRSRCGVRDPGGSATKSKKKKDGSLLREVVCGNCNDTVSKESPQSATADSASSKSTRTMDNSDVDKNNKVRASTGGGCGTQTSEIAANSDDNKENVTDLDKTSDVVLDTANLGVEEMQSDSSENVPAKAIRTPAKAFQDGSAKGQKHKKTTNPKPFRLRTDERGILKEANLERRLQTQKETATAQRNRDVARQNRKSSHEHENQINSEKGVRHAQLNHARIDQANTRRCAEAKLVSSSSNCQKTLQLRIRKEKAAGRLESRTTKVLTPKTIRVVGLSEESTSRTVRQKGNLPTLAPLSETKENNTNMTATSSSKGRRHVTVPKEPIFHKLHVRKDCMKRPEIAAQ